MLQVIRKRVLQSIHHQFCDNQPEAYRLLWTGHIIVNRGSDLQCVRLQDHRGGNAAAKVLQVSSQGYAVCPRCAELALQFGDCHDALVRIVQVYPGFVRLNLAGAEHQDARDNLQAIGNPMLQFLQQHLLFLNQIIFLPRCNPSLGHIVDGEEQPCLWLIAIREPLSVQHEMLQLAIAYEVEFVGIYLSLAGHCGGKQQPQPWNIPFTGTEREVRSARHGLGINAEHPTERAARRLDEQSCVQQYQWRTGGKDDSQAELSWRKRRLPQEAIHDGIPLRLGP